MIPTERERHEFLVSLSSACLISDKFSKRLLLVKDRETGKWQPPAGGLKWNNKENRMETFLEGMVREVQEETGIQLNSYIHLKSIVNIPGKDKNRMGAIYTAHLSHNTEQMNLLQKILMKLKKLNFLMKMN